MGGGLGGGGMVVVPPEAQDALNLPLVNNLPSGGVSSYYSNAAELCVVPNHRRHSLLAVC